MHCKQVLILASTTAQNTFGGRFYSELIVDRQGIVLWLGLSITICYVFSSSVLQLCITNGAIFFDDVLRWNVSVPGEYSELCVTSHNF